MALAVAIWRPEISGATVRLRFGAGLTVSEGSITFSHGRLMGTFTVTNLGHWAVKPSEATVSIAVNRRVTVLHSFRVPKLKRGASHKIEVSLLIGVRLAPGNLPIVVCVNRAGRPRRGHPTSSCRKVGTIVVAPDKGRPTTGTTTTGTTTGTTTTAPTGTTTTTSGLTQPTSQVPSAPVAYMPDTPLEINNASADYYVMVPPSYDQTNQTPMRLLVWLHGCGEEPQNDVYWMSPTVGAQQFDRPWIGISVSNGVPGQTSNCWDTSPVCGDCPKVINAIFDAESHFNIDRRRVVIAGYSSGGDMAYRLAFYHSDLIAGVLAENTSPFRDTGSTAQQSLAAATWKFPVIHLAHNQDEVYPLAGVEDEINAMKAAGFPVTLKTADGTHASPAQQIEDDFTNDVYLDPTWLTWESPAP
ncbi:MAG: hypothetical protein ACYC91_04970 [Solirubrobacteraceae bacterium]